MNALNMQADAQERTITREALHSVLLKQGRPHAILGHQHPETLEWIVFIDNAGEMCFCDDDWHDNDHQCESYFKDLDVARAFVLIFNKYKNK